MKRFLPILAIFGLLWAIAEAQNPQVEPEVGKNKVLVWYSDPISDPTDTFWIPGGEGLTADDSIPNLWGINISQHRWLGFELLPIQADTIHDDSILVDIYTGVYGHRDSVKQILTTDSLSNGVLYDTCTTYPSCLKAFKWVDLYDPAHSGAGFERYVWIRLRTYVNSDNETDTTVVAAPNGDLYSAAGDSLADWNTTNADGIFFKMFTTTADFDSFAYITGKDSTFALSMNTMGTATSPGVIDSITVSVAYWESVTVIAADTFRVGIAFGDTTDHHLDSLDIGVAGSGISWATQQALNTTAETRDTATFTFTTDPYGNTWNRGQLDSCIVIFDPVHVDTTSAGAAGTVCIYDVWTTTYHNRGELFPLLKFRATVYLKD